MNSNCTSLLKEHGCKLWFSNFLGYSVLFWFVSWINTASSLPTNCGEFFESLSTSFSSPMGAIKFLVFTGLFLIIPAFLQSAGTSVTVEAVSNNSSSIDGYFTQGIANLGRMYRLSLTSILCYIPAILVTKHASFQFANFSFSIDNLLSLLAIVLFIVTGLALLHAPYILVTNKTTACEAIRQSFSLFSNNYTGVFVSLFNVTLIYGIVIGSTYYFNPDILNSFHPIRFFLASLALSLSMFAVTYRYYKHFKTDSTSSAHISGNRSCSSSSTSEACSSSDTPVESCSDDKTAHTSNDSNCSANSNNGSCSDAQEAEKKK